jgi:predicted GNAT family acetyltransferase
MSDIKIEREDAGDKGRYIARIGGVSGEAEIAFTIRGPHLVSADHTSAPDGMKGKGVAMALVKHMISDARTRGFKIIPVCPYVKAQYRKHPDWRDVMTVAP